MRGGINESFDCMYIYMRECLPKAVLSEVQGLSTSLLTEIRGALVGEPKVRVTGELNERNGDNWVNICVA
jgi:hypothetical protein